MRRKNRESRFQATYDARDFTADSRRKYKRFNTEQEAMMDLIGKAAPPAPKAASPAPKAAPLTETFSTVTAIRKSSRGATVREKDDDAALMRKYKERQLHAIRLEAEHKKRYTEADLAADELKWNRNRFTTRRYCEQCNLFFLVRSMSEIFGCPQHHHEHLDVIGSLKWENKMFFPVDVYPKAA